MVDEPPFYAPNHSLVAPRTAQPGEAVWRLQGEGHVVACELRNDSRAGLGWDVQLFKGGELLLSKRLPTEDPRWTAQNRPFMDGAKPAISAGDRDW